MPELIAKANEAILEAQWLRRQQRSLRVEARALVSRLGETIVRSHRVEDEGRRTIRDLPKANAEFPASMSSEVADAAE